MKRQYVLIGLFMTSMLISYLCTDLRAYSGGIYGLSGSPGTGQNCSGCHYPSNIHSTVVLTSDLPEDGYIPYQTYNFTLHIRSQKLHAGFNLRPENLQGEGSGIITRTDEENINLFFNGTEITHKNNIVTGGYKPINFQWTAPSQGTGDITFYTALGTGVKADTNGLKMDSLNLFHVIYKENVVSDIHNKLFTDEDFTVSPTIATTDIRLSYHLHNKSKGSLLILNENGKLVKDLSSKLDIGNHSHIVSMTNLPNGLYFVRFNDGVSERVRKVILNK